jgi:sporulation protein YlmC with PRC-barrel domain
MKMLFNLRTTLLIAASGIALTLGAPGTMLAQEQSTAAKNDPQGGLQHSLPMLEQSRQQFEAAQPGQVQQLAEPTQQALREVETNLNLLQNQQNVKTQVQSAKQSLDAARSTLKQQNPDKQQVTQALDRLIQDVRKVQQQTAQLSGNQSDQGAQAGSGNQPKISVQQQPAHVKVQQQQPQITVQQPPPQVIVQQPQPQVTIEQPKPQVTIEQAKPQVSVTQAQPKVTVQQEGQPQVQVQQMQPGKQNGAMGISGGAGKELVGKTIYGQDNRKIGEVENVVMGQNGQVEAVLVDVGGFLGLGQHRVAIPLQQLQIGQDRVVSTLTEKQARDLPEYKNQSGQTSQ